MNETISQFLNNHSKRAQEYVEIIENMMGEWNRYGYAEQTLVGILNYIDENNNITDAQVQAVENIIAKPNTRYGY